MGIEYSFVWPPKQPDEYQPAGRDKTYVELPTLRPDARLNLQQTTGPKKRKRTRPATRTPEQVQPPTEQAPDQVQQSAGQAPTRTVPFTHAPFNDPNLSAPSFERRQMSGSPLGLPKRQTVTEPAQPSWFTRMLKPTDEELEASKNGMRWHYALEHRFMPPGSKFNETVWNGVDRENAWLAQMLRGQKVDDGMMTPIAKQRMLSRISGQYDQLLKEYLKGNWDDPERAYNDFMQEAQRMRAQYGQQGGDPEDLRLPPPVSGGRSELTNSKFARDLLTNYDDSARILDTIQDWVKSGAINDKDFMAKQSAYLDSVYETMLKYIKRSGGAVADAEKQRLQILVLPDNAMAEVEKAVEEYQKALSNFLYYDVNAKTWTENNRGKANTIIGSAGKKDRRQLGDFLAHSAEIISNGLAGELDMPEQVSEGLGILKEQFDTYMEQMMKAGNVSPKLVARMAEIVNDSTVDIHNAAAKASGRAKADMKKRRNHISDSVPNDAMPVSPLIKARPVYHAPRLQPVVKITKPSTLPQSIGENAPKQPLPAEGLGADSYTMEF